MYAVGISVYKSGKVRIVHPTVFGAEKEYYRTGAGASPGGRRYTVEDVKRIIEELGDDVLKRRLSEVMGLVLEGKVNGDIGGSYPRIRIRDRSGGLLLSINPEDGSM